LHFWNPLNLVNPLHHQLSPRHGKQVVSICRFPDIDQIRQLFPVVPKVARADFDPPRGSVVRVTCDAERTLPANFGKNVEGWLIGAVKMKP